MHKHANTEIYIDNKISQFIIIFKSSAAKCNKYNVQQKKTSKISQISFIS